MVPLTINRDHKPNGQYPKEPTILGERRCYFARYGLNTNFAPITETRQEVLWLQFCLQNGFLSEITQEIIVFYLFFI